MEIQFTLSDKAASLINGILRNLNYQGHRTENLVLNVSPSSDISSQSSITTDWGELDIKINDRCYKGFSYIYGKPGFGCYVVVSKPKDPEPKPPKPKRSKKKAAT